MPDPAANAHDEIEGLLSWYATGQIEGDERVLVERHVASCVACQRQLRFDHRMIDQFQSLDPMIDSGWARLRARIDTDTRRPRSRVLGSAWGFVRRPAFAMLAAAQLAFVVVAGSIFFSLARPSYHALGSPAPANTANVIVIFHPDAT